MSEMVERVARAFRESSDGSSVGNFDEQARDAIAAMREPTRPMLMVEAAKTWDFGDQQLGTDTAAEVFRQMIDAALQPEQTEKAG